MHSDDDDLIQQSGFLNLIGSELMLKTIWSTDRQLLLAPTDLPQSLEDRPVEAAKLSLLRFNATRQPPNLTLAEFVEAELGRILAKRDESWVSLRPSFIRILYQSEASNPLSFESLCQFRVPARMDSLGVYGCRYLLMASVRLRTPDSPREYVRTCSKYGGGLNYVRPAKSFVDIDWSLEDEGGYSYILFYKLSMDEDGRLVPSELPQEPVDPKHLAARSSFPGCLIASSTREGGIDRV